MAHSLFKSCSVICSVLKDHILKFIFNRSPKSHNCKSNHLALTRLQNPRAKKPKRKSVPSRFQLFPLKGHTPAHCLLSQVSQGTHPAPRWEQCYKKSSHLLGPTLHLNKRLKTCSSCIYCLWATYQLSLTQQALIEGQGSFWHTQIKIISIFHLSLMQKYLYNAFKKN